MINQRTIGTLRSIWDNPYIYKYIKPTSYKGKFEITERRRDPGSSSFYRGQEIGHSGVIRDSLVAAVPQEAGPAIKIHPHYRGWRRQTRLWDVFSTAGFAPPFSAWRRKEEETLDLARKEVLRLVMFAIFTVDIFKLCVIIQTCIYTYITTYLTV